MLLRNLWPPEGKQRRRKRFCRSNTLSLDGHILLRSNNTLTYIMRVFNGNLLYACNLGHHIARCFLLKSFRKTCVMRKPQHSKYNRLLFPVGTFVSFLLEKLHWRWIPELFLPKLTGKLHWMGERAESDQPSTPMQNGLIPMQFEKLCECCARRSAN